MNKLLGLFLLLTVVVAVFAQDSGIRRKHRRSFDGLLVSPALANTGLSPPPPPPLQAYPEELATIPPMPIISSRNFPPTAHYPPLYSHYMQQSEPFLSSTGWHRPGSLMMLLAGAATALGGNGAGSSAAASNPLSHDSPYTGIFPYGGVPPFPPMAMPYSLYHYPRFNYGQMANYYPSSGGGGGGGSNPKIEIGQKLSNSIYANSDNLRYDLSSMKDYHSQSSLPYSAYSGGQYSAQPATGSYTPTAGSYQSGEYTLPSGGGGGGYRHYLSHSLAHPATSQQAMSSHLYGRVAPYNPLASILNKYSTAGISASTSAAGSADNGKEFLKGGSPQTVSVDGQAKAIKLAKFTGAGATEEFGFFKRTDGQTNG